MNNQFNEFVTLLCQMKTSSDMKDFLFGILTPKERKELPVRLQIVKLLKTGIPQNKIAKKLKVGIATVTRGSKEISQGRFKHISSSRWR